MEKEQSASNVTNKEQPATDVPDKKQATADTSKTALTNQIVGRLEALAKEISIIKSNIESIKPNINEIDNIKKDLKNITEQTYTLSDDKEVAKLFIDIEGDLRILIANSEKADAMPIIIEEVKTLLNIITTRFENFSNILQELSMKQNAFVLRMEKISNITGTPGIHLTLISKILKHVKSVVVIVSWMLIGIGLLRLAEFIWELWKNQT